MVIVCNDFGCKHDISTLLSPVKVEVLGVEIRDRMTGRAEEKNHDENI